MRPLNGHAQIVVYDMLLKFGVQPLVANIGLLYVTL
jgi:hypothetical protein